MSRQCLRCDSYNQPDALHCDQCGSSLSPGGERTEIRSTVLFPALLLIVALGLFFIDWDSLQQLTPDQDSVVDLRPLENLDSVEEKTALIADLSPWDPALSDDPQAAPDEFLPLLWGWVEVEDRLGLSLAKVPGLVTSAGWLAIPRVSLLGAQEIWFRRGLTGEAKVIEGAFRKGDDLSLWRIDRVPGADSAPLGVWDPQRPVWRVLPTGRRQEWVPEGSMQRIGSFLWNNDESSSPAILVQDGAIVGWIVGPQLAGSWFWVGPDEDQLLGASPREFQRAEFLGGQIATARALLDPAMEDLDALQELVHALRRPRLLEAEEIPGPYRSEKFARAAIDRLSRGLSSAIPGTYFDILSQDILSLDPILWSETPSLCLLWLSLALKAGDEVRLSRAVQVGDTILQLHGNDPAWRSVLEFLPDLWSAGAEVVRSRGAVALAIQWIIEGRQRFPADEALRLLDAERLLDAGQLDESSELLSLPVRRSDLKVLRQGLLERLELERRIAGRILISFTPGSTVIRTTALVGGIPVDFVIDTGASATSIPPSVVDSLGIQINDNTPRRRVRTASDEFEAPTVPLPRVDLNGAVVDGMMATVLDMPGQANTGLLGMDFLGRFRIDLDVERGWLVLEPR